MKQTLLPGTKLFKTNEDESITIIRVIKLVGDNIFLCKDINGSKITMSIDDLDSNFSVIKPHAYIVFVAVEGNKEMEHTEDVIVMSYRREEIDNKSELPYCVCRQNIVDFFTSAINPNEDIQYVGMSLSIDTIPEGVNLKDVLLCDSIICEHRIAVYLNDTVDVMLSLIPSKTKKSFDIILYNLTQNMKKHNAKLDKLKEKDKVPDGVLKLIGYCDSLKTFLTHNDFMFDFLNGFKIYPLRVDFSFIKEEENNQIPVSILKPLSAIIGKNITRGIIEEYSEFINLGDMIDSNIPFVLISDIHENIYIIRYESSGDYIPPVNAIEPDENLQKLKNIIPNMPTTIGNDGYKYLDLIRFNKSKYE